MKATINRRATLARRHADAQFDAFFKPHAEHEPGSIWHAYASDDGLAPGTEILITGGTERIQLSTADSVSIETPGAERISAVVVDYSDGQLLMAIKGGLVRLLPTTQMGAFDAFKLSDGFSRQGWTVQ
jgi:hypothetical protein